MLPNSHNQGAPNFDWVRHVWSGNFSPKLKLFMWKILQNAIPIGENLAKRGLLANKNCIRYGLPKTATHLFFHCDHAKEVWRRIPLREELDLSQAQTFIEDSQVLIRTINTNTRSTELHRVLSDIGILSANFLFISFSFIPRTLNRLAEGLAKAALGPAPVVSG
ncbi:unnamed protein product [Thlaspi arvense]|uniref:Reverse transcriptase zinc-binding domain-containing protein n=1 Tax=Thlaspi arvense TaxID=13288 RepID=A0AAU9SLU1_THLAR|nr:unnamed protein product [Thlaspi arvense]